MYIGHQKSTYSSLLVILLFISQIHNMFKTFFQTLNNFLSHRKQRKSTEPSSSAWVYTDNVQLLYGGNFDDSIVGNAPVGSMCDERSGGVNQVFFVWPVS